MSYPIFPVLPLPAGLNRTRLWKVDETLFDSGASIGMTPWQRPLYRYSVPFQNFNEVKHQTILDFHDEVRGRVFPFMLKDPYEFRVNSVLGVRSGFASGSGNLRLYDTRSYFVRADTTTIGSLHSVLSGYVRLGFDYSYEQDTGVFTVNTKAVTDVWGVRSMQYYRKVKFADDWSEQAVIWNIFNTTLTFREDA